MIFSGWDWIILIGTPLIAWLLAAIGKKATGDLGSYRGYFLAQGKLSTGAVAAAYIGTNLTFTSVFLILSEEAFKRGYVVFCVPVFWLVGTFLFAYLYPRIQSQIQCGRTLHQSLGNVFDSATLRKWAAVWTLVAFLGTVALEFYGGIILIRWTGLSLFASVTIAMVMALVVSAFTLSGGIRGVARADIFLDAVTLAAAGIIFIKVLSGGSLEASSGATGTLSAPNDLTDTILFIVSMFCLFVPFQFCTLDSWQRLLAWNKSGKNPKSWIVGGGVLIALGFAVPIYTGAKFHFLGTLPRGELHILGYVLESIGLGTPLLGLCFAGLAGATLSTADELLNCCSMSLLADVWGIEFLKSRSDRDERRLMTSGKLYTALFALAAAGLALLSVNHGRHISDIALAIFSAQVSFVWPLLVLIFSPSRGPRLRKPAICAMAAASIGAMMSVVVGWAIGERTPIDGAPVIAFFLSGLVFVPSWIIDKIRTKQEGSPGHGIGRAS